MEYPASCGWAAPQATPLCSLLFVQNCSSGFNNRGMGGPWPKCEFELIQSANSCPFIQREKPSFQWNFANSHRMYKIIRYCCITLEFPVLYVQNQSILFNKLTWPMIIGLVGFVCLICQSYCKWLKNPGHCNQMSQGWLFFIKQKQKLVQV